METIDPEEPIYELHVNGRRVAMLCAPRWEDMFWCSYQIRPIDQEADRVLRDRKIWETVNFTIKDSRGGFPNRHTFSGGYTEFCDGNTDRLTFRSLWPPQPGRKNGVLNWLTRKLRCSVHWLRTLAGQRTKIVK